MGFLLLVVVGPGCACPLSESTRSQFLLEGSFRQLLAKGYSTILNVQFPSFAGHQFQKKLCPGRKQILEVPRRWLCDNSRSLAVWRNVFHKRPSSSRSTVVGPCSCGKFRVVARTENRFLGRFSAVKQKINKCFVVEICSRFTVRCRFNRSRQGKELLCICAKVEKK